MCGRVKDMELKTQLFDPIPTVDGGNPAPFGMYKTL